MRSPSSASSQASQEVFIITARHGHQAAFARRWLTARGLELPVVNTSSAPKVSICTALNIDLLLDDDILRHAPALLEAGTQPVLYELPHNRHLDHPQGTQVVATWRAFATLVETLNQP